MTKKLYFTGFDYEDLKRAFSLICSMHHLYLTKNESIYFGYKVVKKNGFKYFCVQYSFQNCDFGNGYSLLPMALGQESLCKLLFDKAKGEM